MIKKNTSTAYLNVVKSSPTKIMRVTRNISGLKVSQAVKLLTFSNLKSSVVVRSLIYSAMSNAENNLNMNIDNLYIEKIEVGRSFSLRRFATRGRGKSTRILKTFSNIRVILIEKLFIIK